MTLNELTVNFDHLNQETLIADWKWLIGKNKLPILITASGDAFVQDKTDKKVYFLDVGASKISPIAESGAEFETLLSDKEFVVSYFGVQLVGDLRLSGLILESGQIYSFVKPPNLGGEYELANFEIADIGVHFSMFGQISQQVKNLPEGAKIKEFKITDSKPKSRWKFWQWKNRLTHQPSGSGQRTPIISIVKISLW